MPSPGMSRAQQTLCWGLSLTTQRAGGTGGPTNHGGVLRAREESLLPLPSVQSWDSLSQFPALCRAVTVFVLLLRFSFFLTGTE